MIPYHNIDPVLVELGPIIIRWYSLAYIIGIIAGWKYAVHLAAKWQSPYTKKELDDFILWATLGIILGGRLGYVIFYNFGDYMYSPWKVFAVWNGGMSFHGGMMGMIAAMWFFSKAHRESFLHLADIIACVAPIGLFFGRIANFINGELYGRVTNMPWGMAFPMAPDGGKFARHPSQLYEAFLEGVVLFFALWYVSKKFIVTERKGVLSGIFLIGYGLSRFIVEFFRQPDEQLGRISIFDLVWGSMGQILSTPMILLGGYLIWRGLSKQHIK